ncbi:ABC transporter permease [Streptomyces johnsoniae]|uniref:ABC transporter permease n=1 Tax=Streptomyces johnsoniae TaxID=3075532 RepID=A0ABU2RXV2_9ACTN|nr:ABC transporter permease [Streptomyces sp. DSM 41886]MDT0441049.1 ABC transporter permease [Streptomyces sp. DSM 41886]
MAGLLMAQAVMLVLFAWPNARTEPRDVPIALAGPPPAVEQVAATMEERLPGAFTIHRVADEEAARERIEERDDYGALVLGAEQPRLLVATAANRPIATLLEAVATQAAGGQVAVEDVFPAPSDDQQGAALTMSMLPMVLLPMIVGILLSQLVPYLRWRLAGALTFSVVGGFACAAVLQGWIGVIEGSYASNAGVLILMMSAVSLTLVGAGAVGRTVGVGLGALVVFLFGNPFNGVGAGPEMLPQPWGEIAQLLPAGAGGQLLRSSAFFDGHGSGEQVLILACWVAFGVLLTLCAGWFRRSSARRGGEADQESQARQALQETRTA